MPFVYFRIYNQISYYKKKHFILIMHKWCKISIKKVLQNRIYNMLLCLLCLWPHKYELHASLVIGYSMSNIKFRI